MKKDTINDIRAILLRHRSEKMNFHACESAPPVVTLFYRKFCNTDTYTLDSLALGWMDSVLVNSRSGYEIRTDRAESLPDDYLWRIRRFLKRNEDFIWAVGKDPSEEQTLTVTLSVTQQRFLCELVCQEIDSTRLDLAEKERLMHDKDAAVLRSHIGFLEETLNTLKV